MWWGSHVAPFFFRGQIVYFVIKTKNERKNVRMGGFRSLQSALRKAISIGDADVLSEARHYVAIVDKGKVIFNSPNYG